MRRYPPRWGGTSRERIRDAVVRKGGRYGEICSPFVVAVNACVIHVDETDEMEALFGRETLVGNALRPEQDEVMVRLGNGAWRGPSGPRYTRVSAVLIVDTLKPWTVAVAPVRLYHNPWAAHPYHGTRHQSATEQFRLIQEWNGKTAKSREKSSVSQRDGREIR